MSIPRATTLGYGIPTLALAAMCVTMPTELGIIAAGMWRVVESTWLPAVIVAGVACPARKVIDRRSDAAS